jgi:5-methylcytosine-specific restriction enzyme subunit McrC
MNPDAAVSLLEWGSLAPLPDSPLCGLSLRDSTVRALAQRLTAASVLEVLELAQGLSIHASSYVGTLQLGPLKITVRPKLEGAPLLHLLRYAYGLRHLDLFSPVGQPAEPSSFHDLLIHQLAA